MAAHVLTTPAAPVLPQAGAAHAKTTPPGGHIMNGPEFFNNLEQIFRDHDQNRRAEIRKARTKPIPDQVMATEPGDSTPTGPSLSADVEIELPVESMIKASLDGAKKAYTAVAARAEKERVTLIEDSRSTTLEWQSLDDEWHVMQPNTPVPGPAVALRITVTVGIEP